MGAAQSSWMPGESEMSPREKLLDQLETGGVVIDLKQVQPGPGALLSYNGEQVILYIKGAIEQIEEKL